MPAFPHFLTFDIEEWYHANYEGVDEARYAGIPTNLAALVDRLIGICERHAARATCFVLGSVAREKPAIVRRLHDAGHEIASHGVAHQLVSRMSPEEFRADLALSRRILEDITGEAVAGYRAPSFSVRREMLGWYYDVLEESGIAYSSSVFPGQTFLYGVSDFPPRIHRPLVEGRVRGVVEFPLPRVNWFGRQMGLYFRFFSARAILRRMRRDARVARSTVLYLHPREIDPQQPRLDLPFPQSLIHYWGIRGCQRKLETVLAASPGRFARMRDYAGQVLHSTDQGHSTNRGAAEARRLRGEQR
jgi:polysaccharide deacetylase family protein (PEP-CTERM system associated)